MTKFEVLNYIIDSDLSDNDLDWLSNQLFELTHNHSLSLQLQVKTSFEGDFQIDFKMNGDEVIASYTKWSDTKDKIIPQKTFLKLVDKIANINFTKVYFENCDRRGLDGYRATLRIRKGSYSTSISVWSPQKTKASESNKLIVVMQQICNLVSVEMKF